MGAINKGAPENCAMPSSDDSGEHDDSPVDRYTPDQRRSLSDAVLEAVAAHTDADMSKSEFVLYDAINPDALDTLIRHGAEANPELEFDVGDVRVKLRGNDTTHIDVVDLPERLY